MSPPGSLDSCFDAEVFRREARALVDQLADYLKQATTRAPMPVLPWQSPSEKQPGWPADFPAEPSGELSALVARVLAESNHLHHPRYVGHQVTSPLPLAALCELVSALLNNGMAVYEMGPASTAMERSVVEWLAARAGLGEGADGFLTSGGSAGNLTALLAARQSRAGFDAWDRGLAGAPPLAIIAAEQTHYCVKRSAQIMGLGEGGVVPVPVDSACRLRPELLGAALDEARRRGRQPIAVVASAGSTAAGAFDPIDAIADFCARHGLWLHVDGAHGASVVLSEKYRGLARGIERADSIVWDMHKLMLMPALCTAVLFADRARSYAAFTQEASYLFGGEPDYNGAVRTLECTKRMMSLEVYAALSLCGTRMFGEYIDRMFDLARRFAAMVREVRDFELALQPDCNIVCFRYSPDGVGDLDALQTRVRQRILGEGSFYLVQTGLHGKTWLRTTLINPLTRDEDLSALLDRVRALAS
jgi:L-2,4-diaminobutyrate decarboxylase